MGYQEREDVGVRGCPRGTGAGNRQHKNTKGSWPCKKRKNYEGRSLHKTLPHRKVQLPANTKEQRSLPLGSHDARLRDPSAKALAVRTHHGARKTRFNTQMGTKKGRATTEQYLDKLGVPIFHHVGPLEDVEVVVVLGRQHLRRELLHRLARLALLLEPAIYQRVPGSQIYQISRVPKGTTQ